MPYYESVFITRQEISSQQVESIADIFSEVVKEGGGEVTKRENWGLKALAYRIKKSRKAHYTLFNIDAPADTVHEMERQMRLHEDVLRYMTIRLDELDEKPSIQAQNRPIRSEDSQGDGEFKARKVSERSDPKAPKEPSNDKDEQADISQKENEVSETQPDTDLSDETTENSGDEL